MIVHMKKFICLLAVALLMVGLTAGCTSCSGDAHFGIEYSLQSDGQANGNVAVTFDGGSFNIDGQANYGFAWQNTILLNEVNSFIPLSSALNSKDVQTLEAAKKVDEWLNNSITVTSAGGTYDIYVKGYVKETMTGLTFAIDRHFTNIPPNEPDDVDPE